MMPKILLATPNHPQLRRDMRTRTIRERQEMVTKKRRIVFKSIRNSTIGVALFNLAPIALLSLQRAIGSYGYFEQEALMIFLLEHCPPFY